MLPRTARSALRLHIVAVAIALLWTACGDDAADPSPTTSRTAAPTVAATPPATPTTIVLPTATPTPRATAIPSASGDGTPASDATAGRTPIASYIGANDAQTTTFEIHSERWSVCTDTSNAGSGFAMRIHVQPADQSPAAAASIVVDTTEFTSCNNVTGSGRYFLDIESNYDWWQLDIYETAE